MAKVILDGLELRKLLKDKYGEDAVFTIHYTEPNDIWEDRVDFEAKKHNLPSAIEFQEKNPKISLSFNL